MGVYVFIVIAVAVVGLIAYFNYKREQARRNAQIGRASCRERV